jgi:hypothetical protein
LSTVACERRSARPTQPEGLKRANSVPITLSVTRYPFKSVQPGRFRLHGLDVEVEPVDSGGWRAQVVAPAVGPDWHHGRRAWDAVDAAALAHLAAAPSDETYLRLLVAA